MGDSHASPFILAMRRLWSMPGPRWSFRAIAAVFVVALYAPFVCNEAALIWRDASGLSFPILRSLFNANEYPQAYDYVYNVLALLLPALLVAGWLLRRRWSLVRRFWYGALLWVGVCVIGAIPWTGKAVYAQRTITTETAQAWKALPDDSRPRAVFAPVLAKANRAYSGAKLLKPGSRNTETGGIHLLGTDDATRDVFADLLYGARISLTIGLLATAISMGIGIIIGAISGYFGGIVDLILQRVVEIMMCFPTFILVLIVVSVLGPRLIYIVFVIGLTGWAGTARLVRGEFLAHSGRDYVLAAEALGLSRARIMFRHILPNVLTPLIIGATFGVAGTVFLESGLAFLGLSDPDAPSWGGILEQGRIHPDYLWLILTPGIAIFALVYALNVLGTGLREALDPKSTRRL